MAPSTKQRRSRARRRASQRVVLQETVLAVEDAKPEVIALLVSPLVTVLEVHAKGEVALCLLGPGMPWNPTAERARC